MLKEVEETLEGQELSKGRKGRLETISGGCRAVLEELQALLKKYESLGSQSKRTWDRLNWDAGEISELRARLTSNIVLLTAFMSTCQVVVEQKLNQLIQEFQDGKHEGSILTVATVESLAQDEKQTWRAIRKELEDIGISVAAFDANKDFIMSWFQEAILTGAFEEQNIVDDCEWHGLATSELKSTQSSPTDHMHFSLIDQDMGTIADPVLTTPGLALPYPRLPSKPMSDSRHSGLDEHSQEDIHETLSHNANALPKRRRPRIVTLFARLRGYNNSFIEACAPNLLVGDISDGALVKAADLLEKGADINALYNGNKAAMEWRNNTALGMAAY